jgi:hypothetical protein
VTAPNYDVMTDRELDALCAERVMGWTRLQPPFCNDGYRLIEWYTPPQPTDSQTNGLMPVDSSRVPCFSTYMDRAWQVVEKMREQGWTFNIMVQTCDFPASATFTDRTGSHGSPSWGLGFNAKHKCAPRAIVLAALKAATPKDAPHA